MPVNNNDLDINYAVKSCFKVFQEIGPQTPDVGQFILRKLISNLEAINILLLNCCTHEINMILRSAIESVVLFAYLMTFPDKIPDYKLSSELLELKCAFIVWKNNEKARTYNLDEKFENEFNIMSKRSQEYVLKKLEVSSFSMRRDSDNLEKFFRNDKMVKEPFFMKIENMFKALPFVYSDYTLRDLVYSDYNNCSQILHGQCIKWVRDIELTDAFVNDIKGIVSGIITLPVLYAKKNNIKISVSNAKELEIAIKKLNG